MKTKITTSVFMLAFLFVTFNLAAENYPSDKKGMPDEVKAIVKKSCFGCHNTASKNIDGKEALDFKKLGSLSKIKSISAYKEISDVMEAGEMPPKKFLEKYPDKALSKKETQLLIEWSKNAAEAIVKGE